MVSCLHLEELQYTLSSSHTKFMKIWGQFIVHIKRERPQTGNWLIVSFSYVALAHCTGFVFHPHLGHWHSFNRGPALDPFYPALLVFNPDPFLFKNVLFIHIYLYEWTFWNILLNELMQLYISCSLDWKCWLSLCICFCFDCFLFCCACLHCLHCMKSGIFVSMQHSKLSWNFRFATIHGQHLKLLWIVRN